MGIDQSGELGFPALKMALTPFGREPAAPLGEGSSIKPKLFLVGLAAIGSFALLVGIALFFFHSLGLLAVETSSPPPLFVGVFATFVITSILTLNYLTASWHSRRLNDLGLPGIVLFVMMLGGSLGFVGPIWAIFAGLIPFPAEDQMILLFIPWAALGLSTMVAFATKAVPGRGDKSDPEQIG